MIPALQYQIYQIPSIHLTCLIVCLHRELRRATKYSDLVTCLAYMRHQWWPISMCICCNYRIQAGIRLIASMLEGFVRSTKTLLSREHLHLLEQKVTPQR